MNMKVLAVIAVPFIGLLACSQSETPQGGTGGTPSNPGSGGSTPSGTGGTTVAGTGGTTGTAGTTGTGGSTTGTGGMIAGTGGATGTGGANLTTIVGDWDGALLLFPCQDRRTGYDCTNVGCVNGTKTTTRVFTIGGQSSTVYDVTFRVRGVVEAYAYVGGTRAATTNSITTSSSLFSVGGAQQPVTNGGDYNTYQLTVTPAVAGVPSNTYYLNSVIATENPHTSAVTQHLTFPIDYSATIKVMGGGTVTFTSYDSNCALVQNCGPTQGNQCQAPRTVSLAGAMPAAPTSFAQPYQAPTGSYGQWMFFDVTDVAVAP